jgi:hypothetical protein
MCERPTAPSSLSVSLNAAAELRDALTALHLGQPATALAALMAIDARSWQAIEQRLQILLRPLV